MKDSNAEQDRETSREAWGSQVEARDFRTWLTEIHKEAQDHSERIRARQVIPAWLTR